MIRGATDFWAGLIYLCFGAGAVFIARDYEMGTALRMGPAYFPTVLGWLLMAVGLVSLVRAFLVAASPVGGFAWKGLFFVVGSTLLFGVVLRRAGLVVAVPFLVLASGWASRHFRWGPALALAAGLTVFCAFTFLRGLGVPIPLVGGWLGD